MFVLIITKLLWNSDSPAERSAVAGLPEVFFISLTISIFFSWKNTMKPTTKLKKKGKNNGHIDFKRQMIHRNFFELKWCQELMEKKFVNWFGTANWRNILNVGSLEEMEKKFLPPGFQMCRIHPPGEWVPQSVILKSESLKLKKIFNSMYCGKIVTSVSCQDSGCQLNSCQCKVRQVSFTSF